MTIKHPTAEEQPRLRELWQEAFGDSDAFLDTFFSTAFHPTHCLCTWDGDQLAAALYWFDCRLQQKVAYIYALATAKAYRGLGIAKALMAYTHAHLEAQGYAAALLVPGTNSLSAFYEAMGYDFCGGIQEFSCTAAEEAAQLRLVTPEVYACLRRQYLPEGSVLQEGENLRFLAAQAQLYAGEAFLLAARKERDTLTGLELLGDLSQAPKILRSLDCTFGSFRAPGTGKSFAMFRSLIPDAKRPAYFGLAFD